MGGRDKNEAMAGLLRQKLASGAATEECPAPDILAAYFEHSLDADETARYDLHFSQCPRCREQLTILARASQPTPLAERARSTRTLVFPAWNLAWLAPVAAVLLLAVIWFARRPVRTPEQPLVAMNQPLQQVAQAPEKASPQLTAPQPGPAAAAASSSAERVNPGTSGNLPSAKAESSSEAGAQPLMARNFDALQAARKTEGAPERDAAKEKDLKKEAASSADETVTVESGTSVAAPPASLPSAPEPKQSPAFSAGVGIGGGAGVAGGALGGSNGVARQPQAAAMQRSAGPAVANAVGTVSQRVMVEAKDREKIIHTPDPRILWRIASGGFVEQSKDGGATWQGQLPSQNAHLVAGSAPSANTCWFVGDDGVILLTQDGSNWQTVRPPLGVDFTSVTASDASSATVTAADGRTFTTTDRGKSWTPAQ